MQPFLELLAENRLVFFDGATGTMLQRAGMPKGADPAIFCMERQDILAHIYSSYAKAGSDVITTASFGGTRFKLSPSLDVVQYNKTMASVAKEAVKGHGKQVLVAGSMGPTGHFVQPLGEVKPEDMIEAYREQIRGLVLGGVDVLMIETQFDLAEARLAVVAAKLECDLPIIVSMTYEDGVTLTGSTPEICAATLENLGVAVIAVNCGAGPENMLDVAKRLRSASSLPILAQPNAGLPELINNETVFRLNPEDFSEQCAAFVDYGIQLVGGCCGTGPEHIAALIQKAQNKTYIPTKRNREEVLITSRSSLIKLGANQKIQIIGERINPTGKKKLSAEFEQGKSELALTYAQEQISAGAKILDVNVGAAYVDEVTFLPEIVKKLVAQFSTCLCLDSSNTDALEAAINYYPASCLINSINGEEGRMERLGKLCKNYGTPFVLLPLSSSELPKSANERIDLIEKLVLQAENMGIPKNMIVVDALVLTIASSADAARQCLETVAWCNKNGLATTVGLSNISFGMPARELVNAGFLNLVAGFGLSALIANPSNARMKETLDTCNLLLGYDPKSENFIQNYANYVAGSQNNLQNSANTAKQATSLFDAVLQGDLENIETLVRAELANKELPFNLVQDKLIPAITEVGAKYERKEFFLPQLIRSAETMQKAFAILKPLLEEKKGDKGQKKVVFATVEGDIHDIGKNIVILLMRNYGYDIIDLGKDVKSRTIIDAAIEHSADFIALSALMTTTMPRMEETVKLARAENLSCKILVGGAVVTENYAKSIGAHYSQDAVSAVKLLNDLQNK